MSRYPPDGLMPSERAIMRRRPILDERDALILRAWNILGSERALGYGVVGDIPLRAITHWADRNRLNHEATMILIEVIHRLDADRREREASRRAHEGQS